MKQYIFIVLLTLLPLLLQGQQVSEQTRPGLVNYRIYTLALNESKDLADLYYMNNASKRGGGEVELKFQANSRSAPVIADGKTIKIAKRKVNPETKEIVFQPVAEVAWPTGKTARILLLGTTDQSGQLHIMALDDSVEAFPIHSIRVINATGVELAAQVNDFKGDLQRGISNPVKYPDMEKITDRMLIRYPFALALKNPDGAYKVISSGKLEAAKNTRSLIIIRPPATESSTKVRTQVIMDRPETVKPTSK